MSLIRTGHTPDAWRDEGPAAHVSLHGRIGAQTVTGFVPYLSRSLAIPTNNEAHRSHERSAAAKKLRGEALLNRKKSHR